MFILEVIPLTTLPPQVPQLLSYFFNKSLRRGSVVEVLIGNRKVPAVVVSSSSVEGQKAMLKRSGFQLKKISGVLNEVPIVGGIQLRIALWLSRNYFAPLGMCLKTVLPPFFMKKNYEPRIYSDTEPEEKKEAVLKNPLFILTRAKDVFKNIDPRVKEVLKNKRQILILVPDTAIGEYFYDHFAGYHESALIHGKVPLKQYYKAWNGIVSGDIEVIIGTRQALFCPFKDLGLIIVEDPSNPVYKSDMSPKYWTRDLAASVAKFYGSNMIFIGQTTGVSDHFMAKKGDYIIEEKFKSVKPDIRAINLVNEVRSGNSSSISRELAEAMKAYVSAKKRVLIFSSRKGYSGVLICENCGYSFKCSQCSVPMRFHKAEDKYLVCHRCFSSQKVPEGCPNCRSYKLKAAGIPGSQRLEEEIKWILSGLATKSEILVLDSSVIKKSSEEKELIKKLNNSESCVCIATQMIFSHRYSEKFDLIGLPNMDALTTLPDFKADEELFQQLGKILDFEPEKLILQSFNPESRIVGHIVNGSQDEFYNSELSLRKLFFYPPFSRLVVVSYKDQNAEKAAREVRMLSEKLKMVIIQRNLGETLKMLGPSPAFVEKEKGFHVYNIILKIASEYKPEDILRFVPSNFNISVDPKSII